MKISSDASLSIHKRLNMRTPMIEAPEIIKKVKKELDYDFKLFYPQLMILQRNGYKRIIE